MLHKLSQHAEKKLSTIIKFATIVKRLIEHINSSFIKFNTAAKDFTLRLYHQKTAKSKV